MIEQGQWHPTEMGTPQGGVISPLLANIYLHELDQYWTDHHASVGSLVRYADDMVLICRSKTKAEQALGIIGRVLEGLQLTLHPTKTRLVAMEREGFDFLGFHFHKWKSRTSGKLVPYMWPGVQAMKDSLKLKRLLLEKSIRAPRASALLLPAVRCVERRRFRRFYDAALGIGREVFEDFENGFASTKLRSDSQPDCKRPSFQLNRASTTHVSACRLDSTRDPLEHRQLWENLPCYRNPFALSSTAGFLTRSQGGPARWSRLLATGSALSVA